MDDRKRKIVLEVFCSWDDEPAVVQSLEQWFYDHGCALDRVEQTRIRDATDEEKKALEDLEE